MEPIAAQSAANSSYEENSSGRSSSTSIHSLSISDFSSDTPLTATSQILDAPAVSCHRFIAIIGGLGYIGSHTSLEMLKAGYNILIIDNLVNSYASVLDRVKSLASDYCKRERRAMPQMRFEKVDYRDAHAMKMILDQYWAGKQSTIDGVIHFAAHKSVSESIQHPLKYYNNNVAGLINFCEVLGSYNIKKLVFSSSATVYGATANGGLPLKEEYCVHHPEEFLDHDGQYKTTLPGCTGLTNPYGRSKWMCEAILADLAYTDSEWNILALRYFNPVGCEESGLLREDPRGTPTNLMPVVVNVLTGKLAALDVFGTDYPTTDGSAVRDYIHVTDLACGHVAALASAADCRGRVGFRTYNIGSGTGNSVFEIVGAMEAASARNIPMNTTARRDGDVGSCVAVPTRAEIELNWKAEKNIHACCRDIVNSIRVGGELELD